jgi:hypothetical protein
VEVGSKITQRVRPCHAGDDEEAAKKWEEYQKRGEEKSSGSRLV